MAKSHGIAFKPVLVGGAAAELMSAGQFTSGDFDFVTPWQEAFEEALLGLGFIRPNAPGEMTKGLIHPATQTSVEVVGSRLMDNQADSRRTFEVNVAGRGLRVISVEDLIADRLAQYVESAGKRLSMLEQAMVIYQLSPALARPADDGYLERRIRDETAGEYSLGDLKRALDDYVD